MGNAADAQPGGPLALYNGDDSLGPPLEQKLARLRDDREAHSRKQIWTKDAHGGPYRKVHTRMDAVGASTRAGLASPLLAPPPLPPPAPPSVAGRSPLV